MTVHVYQFGHAVTWDEDGQVFRYVDTGALSAGSGGVPRACPQCRKLPTPEGYDPCLGYIPGVYAACCGHGVETGVIHWNTLRPDPQRPVDVVEIEMDVLRELMRRAGL